MGVQRRRQALHFPRLAQAAVSQWDPHRGSPAFECSHQFWHPPSRLIERTCFSTSVNSGPGRQIKAEQTLDRGWGAQKHPPEGRALRVGFVRLSRAGDFTITRSDLTNCSIRPTFAHVISVNIYEAKTQLSRLVAAVETRGETVVLCRNGTPVADIVPHHKGRDITLEPDPELRGARYVQDPTAPLQPEEWPEELR
jgi:antitoxin (DNA-binding transcriptional repressor) of toxin-antitoxin stability system